MLVLGIGSNCGDRLGYLRDAIQKIQFVVNPGSIEVCSVSPFYESEALLPVGAPQDWNQPFLNVNLLCKTKLPPLELLKLVKSIEVQIGRANRGRWAPREIDIDILIYGDLNFESETLKIPHPGLLERPFAILPLLDLVPNWKISIQGPTFGIPARHFVRQWKGNPETTPFRTRRSNLILTELVGILNVTPDSFSDGGLHTRAETALSRIQTLIEEGIQIIDIGGESTRPGAQPVSHKGRVALALNLSCMRSKNIETYNLKAKSNSALILVIRKLSNKQFE